MFNRIKNRIEFSKEVMGSAIRIKQFPVFARPYTIILDKPIYHSNDYVLGNGLLFALVDINENIWVDDNFRKLTSDTQEVIIAHEIGHLRGNHHKLSINVTKSDLRKRKINSLFNRKTVDSKEIEADLYAVELFGKEKVINALEELISAGYELGLPKNKELIKRIEIIKENM